ncbi:hypothetical protein LguiA_025947 [Lonicera macranthoides]
MILSSAVYVVGTPGCVFDMLRRNYRRPDYSKMFGLDEAKGMLSRSFRDQEDERMLLDIQKFYSVMVEELPTNVVDLLLTGFGLDCFLKKGAARLASNMVLPGRHDKNRRVLCHPAKASEQRMPKSIWLVTLEHHHIVTNSRSVHNISQGRIIKALITILDRGKPFTSGVSKPAVFIDFVNQYLTGQTLYSTGSVFFHAFAAYTLKDVSLKRRLKCVDRGKPFTSGVSKPAVCVDRYVLAEANPPLRGQRACRIQNSESELLRWVEQAILVDYVGIRNSESELLRWVERAILVDYVGIRNSKSEHLRWVEQAILFDYVGSDHLSEFEFRNLNVYDGLNKLYLSTLSILKAAKDFFRDFFPSKGFILNDNNSRIRISKSKRLRWVEQALLVDLVGFHHLSASFQMTITLGIQISKSKRLRWVQQALLVDLVGFDHISV